MESVVMQSIIMLYAECDYDDKSCNAECLN
jgi:hypothetical protein